MAFTFGAVRTYGSASDLPEDGVTARCAMLWDGEYIGNLEKRILPTGEVSYQISRAVYCGSSRDAVLEEFTASFKRPG